MSAAEAEKCLRDFLTSRGGSAPAGEATAYAVAAGHSSATVHRAADRLVEKTRDVNAFTWHLPAPEQSDSEPDAVRDDWAGRYAAWDTARLMAEVRSRSNLVDFVPTYGTTDTELIATLLSDDDSPIVPVPRPTGRAW